MTQRTAWVLMLMMSLAGSAAAQSADQKAVQAVVEDFLLRLGDHQVDTLAADFTAKALIVVTREREPEWTNTYQTVDEWIAALKSNPRPVTFREPLTDVQVTIDDGHLAFVRARFQVVLDGKVQASGMDEFTLVREGSAWKIAAIAYTSKPARQ